MALKSLSLLGLALSLVSAAPNTRSVKLTVEHEGPLDPFFVVDFPDPAVLQAEDGTWVSVATQGEDKKMPYATADDILGEWKVAGDLWPGKGWTNGENIWAPDLRRLDDGSYIIYFAGEHNSLPRGTHCIGILRSDSITGPYKHDDEPWFCPPEGWNKVIDAAGFKDKDGKRYVVYKQEGDTSGPTGGNPLFLQEVEQDGRTMIGDAVLLIDRIESEDGMSTEAPNIVLLKNGMYVLFYSTGHFENIDTYNVKYAYATKVTGPYTRAEGSLINASMFGLKGPGGATSNEAGDTLLFHGWCVEKYKRCLYGVPYKVSTPCRPS
ncbi:hypothetical protein BHE90_006599 [Fusarium euwallaceae]|uniref:Beta-xylosidase C-terminal Concanavalin A-like domain-containing protein n=2 Tax=Fusarium solani species complex TaxID=232080 RepID=A0A430LT64_9HYPO|nr:hypothetical protein CEP51_007617 [Fusarium floridanum]RTE78889.1 hypothetical protein BHE90_006599 [Fusarium euwallaceae]